MMTSGTVLLVACSTEDLQITTRAVPTPQIATPRRVATTSVQVRESQTEMPGPWRCPPVSLLLTIDPRVSRAMTQRA